MALKSKSVTESVAEMVWDLNQFLVKRFLGRVGATVEVAKDGEEAVAMAQSGTYDVILMDIQMPNLDGYEATA